MKKDKLKGYESPNLELVELRFEGMICESTNEEFNEQSNWSSKGGWA